ncbi:MAG TPA: DUF401 family protein [Phycisphaerae bacterium]|nr:DUF401 family protein [Phycisphaerae bacterium]
MDGMPYALSCTLGVFCAIVVLVRLKVPLMAAILAGATAICLLSGRGPLATLKMLGLGAIHPTAIGLVVITTLLLVLSGAMQAGGQMERIVSLARQFLRRPAVAMASLPALIGLLPMPGGAVFSAPMVASAAGGHEVEPARMSAVNYWFRHIWEGWWPLYPGVLTAVGMVGGGIGEFAMYQAPITLLMVASGLLIFRGSSRGLHATGAPPPRGTKRRLLWAASPIWIIILIWAPAAVLLRLAPRGIMPDDAWTALARFGPMSLGVLVAVIWTVRLNRLRWPAVRGVLAGRSIYVLGGIVLSVMVFKHVITQSEFAGRIAAELKVMHVPLVLVVAALPYIAGLVTGLAVGFVGSSFPIVLPLIATLAGEESIRPYVVLAYAFGHLGQMSSPLHVCYIVSNQYFKTPFRAVYRRLVPSLAVMAVLIVGYVLVLRLIVG